MSPTWIASTGENRLPEGKRHCDAASATMELGILATSLKSFLGSTTA